MGVALALRYLRGRPWRWMAGAVHGLTGAAGFALLLVALQGPRRGDAMGVGAFGAAAAVLFGVALTGGLSLPVLLRRSPRIAGVVVAIHAILAITGFVLFLAWSSIGQAR